MTEQHPPHVHALLLPLPVTGVAAPGVLVQAGGALLAGWDLVESTGLGPATVQIIDGNAANGVPLSPIYQLANGGRVFGQLGGRLLVIRSGLFLAVTAGTVSGVCYAAHVSS